MDHEEFFRYCGGDHLVLANYGGGADGVSIEKMYQAFKARLIAELRVTTPELLERAELIDTEGE